MSHDTFVGRGERSYLYDVPVDSDVYALPGDSVGIDDCSYRMLRQGDNCGSKEAKHRNECVKAICQSSQTPDALGISIVVDRNCERPDKTPVI